MHIPQKSKISTTIRSTVQLLVHTQREMKLAQRKWWAMAFVWCWCGGVGGLSSWVVRGKPAHVKVIII